MKGFKSVSLEVIEYIIMVAVYVSIPFIFCVTFTGSDDYKYITILSGCYTGEPSAYTIFMGYIYSAFLSFLYSLYANIEWYTVLHYSLSIMAALSFSYITNRRVKNGWTAAFIQLAIVVLQSYLLISPQYTLLSAELGLLSLFMLYECDSYKSLLLSAMVFLIAISIRFSGALIPYVVGCPVLLFKYKTIINRRLSYTFFLFLSLMAVDKTIDAYFYRSQEWHSFFEYNKERSLVSDNNALRDIQLGDKSKDIELKLLASFAAQDGNILNAEELKSLRQRYGMTKIQFIENNIISYCDVFFWMCGPVCVILLIVTLVLGITFKRRDVIITAVMLVFCLLFALIYLMANSVPKERTIIPIVITSLLVNIAILNSLSNKYINVVVCFCLLPLILWYGFKCWMADSWNREKMQKFEEANTLLSETDIERVLCISNVRSESDIFHYSNTCKAKKSIGSGCNCNSPATKTHYKGYLSLLDGLGIICDKKNFECIEDIKYQLENYYYKKVSYKILNESESYAVFEFYEM